MPIYDYRCSECGHVTTELLSVERRLEPEESICSGCGKFETLKMVIHAPTIGYNSTGWMKSTDSFQDRLKEMKKKVGKNNTVDRGIR